MGRGGWARWVVAAAAAGSLVMAACSGGSHGAQKASTSPSPPTTALTGPQPAPAPSAEGAVRALLTAEQRNDHEASFLLLSTGSRQTDFHNVDVWRHRRSELAPITKFTIERQDKGDTVVVLVEHKPGLDPFTGLAVAKEHQSWHAVKVAGGFLVDGEPTFQPEYPPDDAAKPAALSWAHAVQACDQPKAESLQAAHPLYGTQPAAAGKLCHSTGAITAGAVAKLAPGPASQDIVAQYSSDALEWARSVAVTTPGGPFHVLLAPIGDGWQVIGLAD